MSARRRRIAATRRGLFVTSALIGVGALPQVAWGQAAPNALPTSIDPATLAARTRDATTRTDSYDLDGRNRIFNFTSFDVGRNASVNFVDTANVATATNRLTVINRINEAALTGVSDIEGNLRATNINVFLINTQGVTFGATGSFSGGSLVVSTLPMILSPADEANFTAVGGTLPANLRFAETRDVAGIPIPTSVAPVRFLSTGAGSGQITASGAIVAIAQRVENQKTVTATGGSVALIAASDVTFTRGADNPLFVTLNAGTELGTVDAGTNPGGVVAGGIISGSSVLVAGGAESTITGALLGVPAQTLTATAVNGSVVLATTSTVSGPGTAPGDFSVRISNAAGATPGIVGSGALVTNAGGRDVVVAAAGAVDLGAATFRAEAARDVLLSAGGNLTVGGVATTTGTGAVRAVTAGRDYSASGALVTLGRADVTTAQSAAGAVSITASGNIVGNGSLTVQSNSAGTGLEALTLDSAGTISFNDPASNLLGGRTGAFSDVLIDAVGNVTLGNVTGASLRSVGDPDDLLRVAGDFEAEAISVTDALAIRATGTIDIGGPVTVGAAAATVDLRAAGVTVDGLIRTNGGDVFVSSSEDIRLAGAITAAATVTGNPTLGSVGLLAGGLITSSAGIAAGEDVAANAGTTAQFTTIYAGDDVDLTAGTTLTINGIETDAEGDDDRAATFVPGDAGTGGGITFGAAAADGSNITLTADVLRSGSAPVGSEDAGLVVQRIVSRGTTVDLSAAQGDIRLGALTANDDAAVATITATRGSITGLATDWGVATGGATLDSAGDVTLNIGTDATIGAIDADGAVTNAAGATTVRLGNITAGSVTLEAAETLQLGDLDIDGDVALSTTLGTASTDFIRSGDASLTDLVLTHYRAGTGTDGLGTEGLTAGLSLDITASDGLTATRDGVAWLGTIGSGSVSIEASALDVTRAVADATTLTLVANDGRLTLGSGTAQSSAILWKRNDDAGATTDDALFVGGALDGLIARTSIDIRSLTDATVERATARTGDLRVQATRDATLNRGVATSGTIALLGGRNASSSTSLLAGEDVAVRAGVDFVLPNPDGDPAAPGIQPAGVVTLGTLDAGDDIDLFARGALTLGDATTTGDGPDTREVVFQQASAGTGNPLTTPTSGGIQFTSPDSLVGDRIRIRAGSVDGRIDPLPVPDGGLIVGTLTAGLTVLTASANGGLTSRDIRVGLVDVTGDLTVTTDEGSVSGLAPGWAIGTGGAVLDSSNVVLETTGSVSLGAIVTDDSSQVRFSTAGDVRIGLVQAGSVDLTSSGDLQIGTVDVVGDALLTTLGGTAQTASLTGATLVGGHGAARLESDGLLRVNAADGAAQLGVISSANIRVTADAVDILDATSTIADLYVRADRGRLTLGTGNAAGDAILWKRDLAGDGGAFVPASAANGLFVNDTAIGLIADAIDIRSSSSATVRKATAQDTDLLIEAAQNVTLDNGAATIGTIALLAGAGDVRSNLSLIAGEDVAIRAGGNITLDTGNVAVPHVVRAGDDIELSAGGRLTLASATTTGDALRDLRGATFGTVGVGTSDPEAGPGAIVFTTPDDLANSNIRIRAGSVTGPGVGLASDDGLVIGRLNSADATIDAALGDIRIEDATTRTGDLSIGAVAGSVSGVATGWAVRSGSSILTTPGRVIIRSDGDVVIGTVAAGGAVSGASLDGTAGLGSIRIGAIRGETVGTRTQSVDLTAVGTLQIGTADVRESTTLATTGGTADPVALVGDLGVALISGYGTAKLTAASDPATLGVSALNGVAQLGVISGGTVAVAADAVDVERATSTFGRLSLLAESGRLTLVRGQAATDALLWKTNDDGVGDPDRDALFVTDQITATTGINVRSLTDATVARALTSGGDLSVQATRDAALGTGTATLGTLALAAGRDALSLVSLTAGEDVAIHAVRNLTLGERGATTRHLVQARDDIDLFAGNNLYFADLITTADGANGRDVAFAPGQFGRGDPRVAGTGGVLSGAGTLPAGTVRLRAFNIDGPAMTGSTDAGLVVQTLTSNVGNAVLDAALSDIRIENATATTGNLTVTATAGSVSGLRDDWEAAAGGSTVKTPGLVRIEATGTVRIGSIAGATDGTRADDVTGISTGPSRYGTIAAGSLALTAGPTLQVGTANVTRDVRLNTTGGAASTDISLTDGTLVDRYGAANLSAFGATTVDASVDAAEAATGPIGVAQLGTLRGARIAITADALDVVDARAGTGGLALLAERGRLTLGFGDTTGQATLWKRDKDAVAGVAATPEDALVVTTLNATAGIDARSATDATLAAATARGGDLVVQAARDARLAVGDAVVGTLALAAGRDASSLTSLTAGEDVAIYAGRDATLGDPASTARHAVTAGDDVDVFAGETLYFTDLLTTGSGADTRGVTFVPGQIGLGNPLVALTGGVQFGAETLPAGTVRLRSADITGPALTGSTDLGLVVQTLTSDNGDVLLDADLSDIRVENATSGGDLTANATLGSISGLRAGWEATGGGSIVRTPGQVIVEASGTAEIGAIAGAVDGTRAGSVSGVSGAESRFGTIAATDLSLTAGPRLQVGTATVTNRATLRTTSGAAGGFSLTDESLVSGYGAANLSAINALTVTASVDPSEAAIAPIGVAQLGIISGSRLSVTADAIDIVDARTTLGAMNLLAERGRLTLGFGEAATEATLWKRDKDAEPGVAAALADGLFVTTLNAGTNIDARSATDATVTMATARTGDLLVQAVRDVSLATGTATLGTLALAAGGNVASLTSLTAGEDVAIDAGGNVTLGVRTATERHQLNAGDDVDIRTDGTLYFADIATSSTGPNTRGVSFVAGQKGLQDPLIEGSGGILLGAETLPAGTVRLRAAAIEGPALTGSTDTGLVVERLTGGSATFTANLGDIRIGTATTGGALTATATNGSVTGLREGWTPTGGGSSVQTIGQVIINAGNGAIGSIAGTSASNRAGAVSSSSSGSVRYGTIAATSLDVTAGSALQIGSADVVGATSLTTTAGAASTAIDLTAATLATGYGRADLDANGVLTVGASVDPTETAIAPIGVAQLGVVRGSRLSVTADAIDIVDARTTAGAINLLAERGRLTLGFGEAATAATLWKRDKDAEPGVAASLSDGLFVTTLTAGTGIDARSATDATVTTATATTGDLLVQAVRDVSLATGTATLGTLALAAGGNVASLTSLTAGEDVAIDAGGNVTLGVRTATERHQLNAGDDVDIRTDGTLYFADIATSSTGPNTRGVSFVAGQKGLQDPLIEGSGGILLGAETLPAGTVRLRAAAIEGPALTGSTDTGLVVERLTGGSATFTANLGDIRIGTATTGGALTATATNGSVTGLREGWTPTGGGSSVQTIGQVIINAGNGAIGSIAGTSASNRAGAVSSSSGGSLRYGTIAATSLDVTAGAALQIGSADVVGATSLTTTAGTASTAIDLTAAMLATGYGRADLDANGVLTVGASVDAGEAATGPRGVAQLGTISGSSLSVTADAIDVTRATSDSGTLSLLAERGKLTLGTGMAATRALLWKRDKDAVSGTAASAADILSVTTLTGGTGIDARSATNAAVTTATATTGDLLLQATRDVSLVTGTATVGSLALLAGGNVSSATSLTAGEDVAIRTAGTATLGALSAGDDITILAAGTVALGSATTTGTAGRDTRSVVFTPAQAGLGDPAVAGTGGIGFDAEVPGPVTARLTGANIRIETRGDVQINGAVAVTGGSTRTIRLVNAGSTSTTAIGDGVTGGFALSDAEMDRLNATNVIIDSGANALSLGTLSLVDSAGAASLKFLTSGAVTLAGPITGTGPATRTLQIGGDDGVPNVTNGSNLAASITANTGGTGDGAGITLPGIVDLRARRVLFGTGAEFLALGTGTNDAAAFAVSNAGSALYLGNRSRETYLTVSQLSVSYSDFALFQNTQPGASAGVALGSTGNSVTNLALQLFSTGDNRDNSFAIFGTINGFIGRAAGVLPNEVLNIAESSPRVLRVTQSNTRVNGCVIGSPDRGCLITDVPRADFRLYDERQTQLITAAEDPSLYANPLIGRGNEGLIVDIADVPVGIDTIECPEDDPNCRSPRSPK